MVYTIEEKNLERQHILALVLNPLTIRALENISLQKGSQILDIGCGIGDTTLMLSQIFSGAVATGVDQDEALIEAATATKELYPNLHFLIGDALKLPFADNSFDFVFCRYLLQHIPDPVAALKEMKRVCKKGAIIFVHEPDANSLQSYPESRAYPKMIEFINVLFADAVIGRKLISYFNGLELANIGYDTQALLGDHNSPLKKFYSMTAVSLRKALLQRKLIDNKGIDEWIEELEQKEHDRQTIVLMHPSVAVWAVKPW